MPAPRGAPAPTFRPPLIGNRYVVRHRIGRGGTSSVYAVYDLRLRLWRAAKVMHLDTATDEGLRERFSLEAAAMANLEHPNIVRVWDVAVDVEIPYLVMELLEGGTVSSWLKHHGPMSPELALYVIDEILAALEFVHGFGVVHRDVNPRNVLVDRTGQVKLTDFGLARVTDDAVSPLVGDLDRHPTEIGTTMGTEYYMAPEQRQDAASVDARADLYGIGATLFSLLTARVAPDLTVLGGADPRIRELPPMVAPLIVRACSYRPENRHADAAALRSAISKIRRKVGEIDGKTRLAPILPPLPPVPPKTLDPAEVETLGELVASGAVSGPWDGGRSDVSAFRDLPQPVVILADMGTRALSIAAGGLLGLVVGMLALVMMVGFGTKSVHDAERDAADARDQFHDALRAHRADIGEAAGDAWADFEQSGTEPIPAEHLYDVLRAVYTDRTTPPNVHQAMVDLTRTHNEEYRAYRWWTEVSAQPCGRIAVLLGLGAEPEFVPSTPSD